MLSERWVVGSGELGLDLFVDSGEVDGVDAGVGGGGEEVDVAVPAGDEVPVEVLFDAGSGGGAEVEADVEAVGAEGGGEGRFEVFEGGEAFKEFVVGEVFEVGDDAVGEDESVAGVVGVAVQDGEAGFAAPDDAVCFVFGGGGLGEAGEDFASGGGGVLHIGLAPRSPKMFHGFFTRP